MGLFDPQWVKAILEDFRPAQANIRKWEDLRQRCNIAHAIFAHLVINSPAGIQNTCEVYGRGFKSKYHELTGSDTILLAYLVMVGNELAIPLSPSSMPDTLLRVQKENQTRVARMSSTVTGYEDLAKFWILEHGSYSDATPELLVVYKLIDLAVGWHGYAQIDHVPPTHPKPASTYGFSDMLDVIETVKQMSAAIDPQATSYVNLAYQIAGRLKIHPYQAICVLAFLAKSAGLALAGYSAEQVKQEIAKSGLL